jgi:hypothetical protein
MLTYATRFCTEFLQQHIKAFTITVAKIVDDGFVSIQGIGRVNKAKISGIEIVLKEVHTTHPVSQGPVSRF